MVPVLVQLRLLVLDVSPQLLVQLLGLGELDTHGLHLAQILIHVDFLVLYLVIYLFDLISYDLEVYAQLVN